MEKCILTFTNEQIKKTDNKKRTMIKKSIYEFLHKLDISKRYAEKILREDNIKKTISKVDRILDSFIIHSLQSKYVSKRIANYILNNPMYIVEYNVKIYSRNISILFYIDSNDINKYEIENKIHDIIDEKIQKVIMILYFLSTYATNKCSTNLKIHCFMTKYKKYISSKSQEILNSDHVNTAVTTSCVMNGNILIYREEEWFKVLVHELFHVFGLDFSMNFNKAYISKLREKLNINSEYLVYETYNEFWATILNTLCYTYLYMYDCSRIQTIDLDLFYQIYITNLNIEMTYSLFQTNKLLRHMGLTPEIFWSLKKKNIEIRRKLFKEDTNVLAYYILKTNLLIHYEKVFEWCLTNNKNILYFNEDTKHISNFVELLLKLSYHKDTHKNLQFGVYILKDIINSNDSMQCKNELLRTNRMTILDIE